MISRRLLATTAGMTLMLVAGRHFLHRAQSPSSESKLITESDCIAEKLGSSIPVTDIGEPVAAVTLAAPRWVPAGNIPAYCSIDGAMAPMDTSAYGRAINFRVILPASWSRRA